MTADLPRVPRGGKRGSGERRSFLAVCLFDGAELIDSVCDVREEYPDGFVDGFSAKL